MAANNYDIDYTIKQNDAGRVISGQFLDANSVAVNCTSNTSRKVFMRKSGVLKINGAAFTFTNAAEGRFSYSFTATDLNTAGDYQMEFETILSGPMTVTFPTDVAKPYLLIRVQDDLG